jgi:hypothetical protein
MTPGFVHFHQLRGDLFFGKQHFKHLVPEYLFKVFEFKKRGHPEHTLSEKTPIRTQDMQVGVESKKVTKCLHSNNSSGHCVLFLDHFREKFLQGFPSASTQIRKQFPVPGSGQGQAPRKYRRRNSGTLKTRCRCGTSLRTSSQSHSPNSTTRF